MCQADWEQQTDERLALAAKNQQAAMAVLLNRYSNRIWFHARRLCGVLDAEDLAQEGFLGLCGAVLGYRNERGDSFFSYAQSCIVNSMLSAMRRCQNLPYPVGAANDALFEGVPDQTDQPDSLVVQKEWTAQFCNAMLKQLSKREYQVCMLVYAGATYQQAAQQLQVPVKAVDNALQRARRKLRMLHPQGS